MLNCLNYVFLFMRSLFQPKHLIRFLFSVQQQNQKLQKPITCLPQIGSKINTLFCALICSDSLILFTWQELWALSDQGPEAKNVICCSSTHGHKPLFIVGVYFVFCACAVRPDPLYITRILTDPHDCVDCRSTSCTSRCAAMKIEPTVAKLSLLA